MVETTTLRLLLVEDNEGDVALVKALLADASYFSAEVQVAARLSAAAAALERSAPDLILLDLGLPDSQGAETVARMRALRPEVPIVVLTGAEESALGMQSVEAGAQDYLVKGELKRHALERAARYAVERQRLLRELEEAADRLRGQNDELRRAHEEIESFVHFTSHDLRAIVLSLRGATASIGKLVPPAPVPAEVSSGGTLVEAAALPQAEIGHHLHRTRAATDKLEGMIDGMLQVLRAGREELRPTALDMQALANEVIGLYEVTIAQHGAEVRVGDVPPAVADRNAVHRVLANLLGNALKFLAPERTGRIEIGGAPTTAGWAHYFVRDNGIGMEAHCLERVFRPFNRLGHNAAPGEGLGLAIVKRLIERHGGQVQVESTPDEGSTFSFTLPAAAPRRR